MVVRNGKASWDRVIGRLSRKPSSSEPVWHPLMTALSLSAAILFVIALIADPYLTSWVTENRASVGTFFRAFTDVAKSHYYAVPAAIIFIAIGLSDWRQTKWRRRRLMLSVYAQNAFIFVAIIGFGIAINIVKQFIGRGRPNTFDEFGAYAFSPFEFDHAFQSFPSGHATTSGVLAMLLVLWFPRFRMVALIAFAIIAFARVGVKAHYLSDVIVGFTIGALGTLVLARLLATKRVMFTLRKKQLIPILVWV